MLADNNDEVIRRAIKRHRRKERRRARKAAKPQCEVIQCGPKGPHRCPHRGWRRSGDGRIVCTHHQLQAPHVVVFTETEALALYRERFNNNRIWLTEG